VQVGGAFVEMETGHGRRYELPAGVSVAVDEAESESEDSVWYVQFYPDGRCDPATIELAGSEGDVLHVTCPSPSERFRVVLPSEDEKR